MENFLQKVATLQSSTSGLDKLFKCIIYTLKLLNATSSTSNTTIQRILNPLMNTRVTMRLGGLIPILLSIPSALDFSKPLRINVIVQMISMLVYYSTEHVYWLGINQILKVSDSWSIWSCRAWAIYIMCDLLQSSTITNTSNTPSDKIQTKRRQLRTAVNWCDLMMALQWSVDTQIVNAHTMSMLGVISGYVNLYLTWTQ